MKPRVRIVVLAHNGAPLTVRCLDSIEKLDWPKDRLEVVVIDNASTDDTREQIATHHPSVRVIVCQRNLGFASGNNLGLTNLDDIDHVALLNNDTVVDPDWLEPLVDAIERDPQVGAVCPKILFDSPFCEMILKAPVFRPGSGDQRELGVRVGGVEPVGAEHLPQPQFIDGFFDPEFGSRHAPPFRWSGPEATIRVAVSTERRVTSCRLLVSAELEKSIRVTSGEFVTDHVVDTTPRWIVVPIGGEAYPVINNAGSELLAGGYAGDRGYCERDIGQFDEPREVFAWCGCSVLLSKRYLQQTGLLDERFFLYYEDIDLSWRGRALGWRYRYEPASVVHHVHSASSVEHSALFQHQVERNRLLMLTKNAPAGLALHAWIGFLKMLSEDVRRDLLRNLIAGRRPHFELVRRRSGIAGSALRALPGVLASRVRIRWGRSVGDDELMAWTVRR